MQSLDAVSSEIIDAIGAADSLDALEAIRIDALGKKGRISLMMRDLGGMDDEARKQAGQALNKVKDEIATAIDAKQTMLASAALNARLSGSNAQVSLLNYQMDVAGISRIAVSDSQEVNLYPRGGRITVNEGMDFDFDGRINAGLFSYWGQGYSFDYDYFKIDMPQFDSMRFKVKEFNPKPGERAALVNVQTLLQYLQE